MTEQFACISKNIVYGITFEQRTIIYIGNVGYWLANSLTEHIHSIESYLTGSQLINWSFLYASATSSLS